MPRELEICGAFSVLALCCFFLFHNMPTIVEYREEVDRKEKTKKLEKVTKAIKSTIQTHNIRLVPNGIYQFGYWRYADLLRVMCIYVVGDYYTVLNTFQDSNQAKRFLRNNHRFVALFEDEYKAEQWLEDQPNSN